MSAYRDELFGRLLGSTSVYYRSLILWYTKQSDKHEQKKINLDIWSHEIKKVLKRYGYTQLAETPVVTMLETFNATKEWNGTERVV